MIKGYFLHGALGWSEIVAFSGHTHLVIFCLSWGWGPGVTGRNFPPVSFFPGERMGRPILSPGKNRPAHSFPTQSVSPPPPPHNFKNHNGIIISLHKSKKALLN